MDSSYTKKLETPELGTSTSWLFIHTGRNFVATTEIVFFITFLRLNHFHLIVTQDLIHNHHLTILLFFRNLRITNLSPLPMA